MDSKQYQEDLQTVAAELPNLPNEVFDLLWLFVETCPCNTFGTLWNPTQRPNTIVRGYSGYCVRCTGDICDKCSKQCRCGETIGLCTDCRSTIKKIKPYSTKRSELCAEGFCVTYCGPCRTRGDVRCPTECTSCKKVGPVINYKNRDSWSAPLICNVCDAKKFIPYIQSETRKELCDHGVDTTGCEGRSNRDYHPCSTCRNRGRRRCANCKKVGPGVDFKRCESCRAGPLCRSCRLTCGNGYPYIWSDYGGVNDYSEYHATSTDTDEFVWFCKLCGQTCKECGTLECPKCVSLRCRCGKEIKCAALSGVCHTCKEAKCSDCATLVYHEFACVKRTFGFCGIYHSVERYHCKSCEGGRFKDCGCRDRV